uniref:Uncharacterized protein n=1 Tax=Candidozyma auris TaxID=498019 RepID=A0A0L0NYK5_CANAR
MMQLLEFQLTRAKFALEICHEEATYRNAELSREEPSEN